MAVDSHSPPAGLFHFLESKAEKSHELYKFLTLYLSSSPGVTHQSHQTWSSPVLFMHIIIHTPTADGFNVPLQFCLDAFRCSQLLLYFILGEGCIIPMLIALLWQRPCAFYLTFCLLSVQSHTQCDDINHNSTGFNSKFDFTDNLKMWFAHACVS